MPEERGGMGTRYDGRRRGRSVLIATVAASLALPAGATAQTGAFSAPFAEPTIEGQRTTYKCIRRAPKPGREPSGPLFTPHWECKPTAGSLNVTPIRNRLLYWNALEGTENINAATAAEFGSTAENDQTRRLDLNPSNPFASIWSNPTPVDGGGNPPPQGNPDKEFLLVPKEVGQQLDPAWNDGSLFCADNNFLPDGRVIATGGTTYKNDPPTGAGPLTPPGPAELQGMRNTAVYDPRTNRWQQTPRMNYGRWYPALVTLGARGGRAGDQFVASGVKNLIKAYDLPDQNSPKINRTADNVQETEVRNSATGQWEVQGPKDAQDPSDRPLPLFPRLHLLPNGHVYYNAGGQVFNPAGESYNQLLWNVAAAFDPETKRWNDVGVPGVGPGEVPDLTDGFRGSTFSVMLTLQPGAERELPAGVVPDRGRDPRHHAGHLLPGQGQPDRHGRHRRRRARRARAARSRPSGRSRSTTPAGTRTERCCRRVRCSPRPAATATRS